MSITSVTAGVQTVVATGAINSAGLDTSAMTGDVTLVVEILNLTAGKTARIQVEDSVNAFVASLPVKVINVIGQLGTPGVVNPDTSRYSFRKYELPNNRFGTASSLIRLNITAIDASTSLTVSAWIEQ